MGISWGFEDGNEKNSFLLVEINFQFEFEKALKYKLPKRVAFVSGRGSKRSFSDDLD